MFQILTFYDNSNFFFFFSKKKIGFYKLSFRCFYFSSIPRIPTHIPRIPTLIPHILTPIPHIPTPILAFPSFRSLISHSGFYR